MGLSDCPAVAALALGAGLLLGVAAVDPARAVDPAPATEPRFTPPPGEEPAAVAALIDKARADLQTGREVADLLSEPGYLPAHPYTRFRGLIREHARLPRTTIVTADEPGPALTASGTVRDREGKPVNGALIYVYQTSAKGWYSDQAPHVSGMSGDERHARLFGYMTTGEDGAYELRTVRPSGYPGSDLPGHIHVEIEPARPGSPGLVTEIRFGDDPRMTPAMRERSSREGYIVCPVRCDASGRQQVRAEFMLP